MTWKSQRHFSEEAFLQATFSEFVKCWGSGKRARIFMESVNGGAFVSFSTFLGNPGAPHIDPRKTAKTSRHPEGHHDSQNGGNPHFQAAFKTKSKRKTERDNARAAEFQKKKKEEAEQEAKEKTSRKDEEETKAASEEESEEVKESEMTISSLDSSPVSRKFSFASPVQETLEISTLRHDMSLNTFRILDDEKDQTRQDETEVYNDGKNDDVDEDKVDSLNEYIDVNDGENRDDNLEGFREENNDNTGDVEEENEPGRDIIPEPPPQPTPYRPPQPCIKLSCLGTTSFQWKLYSRKHIHTRLYSTVHTRLCNILDIQKKKFPILTRRTRTGTRVTSPSVINSNVIYY